MHQVRYVSVLFVVHNVLLVCGEMWCDEWVMHGMMRWDAVWWMGDA